MLLSIKLVLVFFFLYSLCYFYNKLIFMTITYYFYVNNVLHYEVTMIITYCFYKLDIYMQNNYNIEYVCVYIFMKCGVNNETECFSKRYFCYL